MQRVVVRTIGGPEQLTVETASEPLRPGPGQLLVEVEAAGVNFLDVQQRRGTSKVPLPHPLGLEGVGRVCEVGDGVDGSAGLLALGCRVSWFDVRGSYASHLLVPAARAIPVPDSFSVGQALIFQALTAQYLATEYRSISPGDRVLVHSAAGGVGQLLIQWLKHLGAWVVGTVSTDAKANIARSAGADAVINYGRDYSFADAVQSLTAGKGVDLVFDSVGEATLKASLKSLARGGTVVSFGFASGHPHEFDPRDLIVPCTRLAGGSVFSYNAEPAELQRRAAAVIGAIEAGWLRPSAGTAYPLARVADAHRDIEGRSTDGKLYLVP